jgi:hypothetical protein
MKIITSVSALALSLALAGSAQAGDNVFKGSTYGGDVTVGIQQATTTGSNSLDLEPLGGSSATVGFRQDSRFDNSANINSIASKITLEGIQQGRDGKNLINADLRSGKVPGTALDVFLKQDGGDSGQENNTKLYGVGFDATKIGVIQDHTKKNVGVIDLLAGNEADLTAGQRASALNALNINAGAHIVKQSVVQLELGLPGDWDPTPSNK